MPIVTFKGRVLPEHPMLSIDGVPKITFHEPALPPHLLHDLDIEYSITIVDSQFEIVCDIAQYEDDLFVWIYNRAINVVHALVDLYCFGTGVMFTICFDTSIDPLGEESKILVSDPRLGAECTFLHAGTPTQSGHMPVHFGKALPLLIQDSELFLSLRDLISGASSSARAAIDCPRAIEGLRSILVPNDPTRKAGWATLQDELNISRTYREYITGTSTEPRHGNKSFIPGDRLNEVIKRSWIIMNRFIEYRLRGSQKLKAPDFPLL